MILEESFFPSKSSPLLPFTNSKRAASNFKSSFTFGISSSFEKSLLLAGWFLWNCLAGKMFFKLNFRLKKFAIAYLENCNSYFTHVGYLVLLKVYQLVKSLFYFFEPLYFKSIEFCSNCMDHFFQFVFFKCLASFEM